VTSSHTISATFAADTVPVLDTVGPVTTSVKISPKINKRTSPTSVTLSAVIDDAATGGSTIAGAEYFVDGIGPNGTGHQMSPATTAIASPTVTESATIDLLGLTAGRHIIYVHGQDSSGNWGPTARIRFRVVISTSPSSSPKRIAMTGQLSGNSDDDRDDAEEIEVDENSKGDVIQIVDHLSSGQDIILWPDNSSDYSDSE